MATITSKDGALSVEVLKRANVNPETGLATDYLNHFNEAVMLLEMVADMPELAEDVLAWRPCAYEDHFERTHYAGKDVAIAAWRTCPAERRAQFQILIAALDNALIQAQAAIKAYDFDGAKALAASQVAPLLSQARACINGESEDQHDSAPDQAGVDALFG